MREIFDFASVLMKLVLILLVMLMAGSLAIAPESALTAVPAMLMLVVPLFILVTVLDIAGVVQNYFVGRVAHQSARRWSHD